MPACILSTNVNLSDCDSDKLTADLIKSIAAFYEVAHTYVMVVLKGSLPMTFGSSKDPAAYIEVIAMRGLTPEVVGLLTADLATVLESNLGISKKRLFSKVHDVSVGRPTARLWSHTGSGGPVKIDVYLPTNINLDGHRADILSAKLTEIVAGIIGKPESDIMVVLNGSLPITFELNKDPAAIADILSMGAITTSMKRKLISDLGTLLQSKYNIPNTRFICTVQDTTDWSSPSKL